jgi:hypothetical protein
MAVHFTFPDYVCVAAELKGDGGTNFRPPCCRIAYDEDNNPQNCGKGAWGCKYLMTRAQAWKRYGDQFDYRNLNFQDYVLAREKRG